MHSNSKMLESKLISKSVISVPIKRVRNKYYQIGISFIKFLFYALAVSI